MTFQPKIHGLTGPNGGDFRVVEIGGGFQAPYSQEKIVRVPLAAEGSPANGGMLSWQNTEVDQNGDPVDIMVHNCVLEVETPATGAATADVGVAAAQAATDDRIFDGIDIGTAAAIFDDANGTNGQRAVRCAGGDWVVGTAGADSTGLVGYMLITYKPLYPAA